MDVYIATGKGEKKDHKPVNDSNRKTKKADFTYDEDRDCFIYPADHTLQLKIESTDGKKVYQAVKSECNACPHSPRCCSSKKGEPRTINIDDKEPLR